MYVVFFLLLKPCYFQLLKKIHLIFSCQRCSVWWEELEGSWFLVVVYVTSRWRLTGPADRTNGPTPTPRCQHLNSLSPTVGTLDSYKRRLEYELKSSLLNRNEAPTMIKVSIDSPAVSPAPQIYQITCEKKKKTQVMSALVLQTVKGHVCWTSRKIRAGAGSDVG